MGLVYKWGAGGRARERKEVGGRGREGEGGRREEGEGEKRLM
jgi:hypothetical protein